MATKYLLPHRYKSYGALLMPIGLIVWYCVQRWGLSDSLINNENKLHIIKVLLLYTSFLSFIFGAYCLVFSKEKEDDEYIGSICLQSFQMAAFIQMAFFIISFLIIILGNLSPAGDTGLEVFLFAAIALFWLTYIIHFNLAIIQNKRRAYEE